MASMSNGYWYITNSSAIVGAVEAVTAADVPGTVPPVVVSAVTGSSDMVDAKEGLEYNGLEYNGSGT